MAATSKKKPYGKLIITGIVSLGLYVALLGNQEIVNTYCGKGGTYAFLPIVMAFIFSFVHGSFTGHFWSVMGVEASKKKEAK